MAPLPPNVYDQVLAWITQQQQLALAGQPATMTAAQRKALVELHQLVKPADVEPDFQGGAEWISFLNYYRQTNPSAAGIAYTDEPVGEPPAPIRWVVYCRIAECREAFPGPAGGLDPATGRPPSFARKQSAKAYAAKCAYEWLLARGYTRTAPPGQQPQPQPQLPAPTGGVGAGDGQYSKQVAALCVELGLLPPRYHIDEVDSAYDGFASFEGITRHRFPSGQLGHVRQALTRSLAKEMIAEGVAKALLEMKQDRARQNAAIMGPAQS